MNMECGCGRSPTGKCIGWHKLSEEEYQEKLKEYQDKEKDEKTIPCINLPTVNAIPEK